MHARENVFQEARLTSPSSCNPSHGYCCPVNITTTAYKTTYEYSTDKLLAYEGVEKNVTGLVLRWNIADLFDAPTCGIMLPKTSHTSHMSHLCSRRPVTT